MTHINSLTVSNMDTRIGSSTAPSNPLILDGSSSYDGARKNVLSVRTQTNTGGTPADFAAEFVSTKRTSGRGGIQITLNETLPNSQNYYVSFHGATSNDARANPVVGGIQAVGQGEISQKWTPYINDVAISAQDSRIALFETTQALIEFDIAAGNTLIEAAHFVGSTSSASACGGVVFYGPFPVPFFCGAAPEPKAMGSDDLVVAAIQLGIATSGLAQSLYSHIMTDQLQADYDAVWKDVRLKDVTANGNSNDKIGINYASGAGDYAEWLPKENIKDKLYPGQIVGCKGGEISLIPKLAKRQW